MKGIFYRLLYLVSGMVMLLAIATTLAGKPSWQSWVFSLAIFWMAYDIEAPKTPKG